MRIKLSKPYITGNELKYIEDIIKNGRDMCGDGIYTKRVQNLLEKRYKTRKALLTTSGTTALEMAVRLLNLKKGDEVIAPSFTFSSTINAILLQAGVKVVFAEVDPKTLNISPDDIKKKITKKTKVLMVVHYAGVACEMGKIMRIAKKHNLKVIEDAAQAIESTYKGKQLGTFGDFGCFSFHDTKNITAGEAGALFINTKNKEILEQAEIIREKGTNRTKFFRGEVDKYTWVATGSSYLPSDILAAYLLAQLEQVEKITKLRMKIYNFYKKSLKTFAEKENIQIPTVPTGAKHNAHIFYVLFASQEQRNFTMDFFKKNNISAVFHYIPLHSAPKGMQLGYKSQDLPLTESLAGRLLRLPIYSGMRKREYKKVVKVLRQAVTAWKETQEKETVTLPLRISMEQSFMKTFFNTIHLW